MKIIEAMKKIKALQIKAEDLRGKIKDNCANLSLETPRYADPRRQVAEWLQAHADIMQEIPALRLAIQKTNLATEVTIRLGDNNVTKTIAAWIHRRRDLADFDRQAWAGLGDRGLKEGQFKQSTGQPDVEVKIIRHFDAAARDAKIELYRSEPMVIDATLEVTNAVTDLIES